MSRLVIALDPLLHVSQSLIGALHSASGLGRATTCDLHSHGGAVAVLDMNEENGQALINELGAERAHFYRTDVTDTDSIAEAVKGIVAWTKETGKAIGGVIAAAGVGFPGKVRYDLMGSILSRINVMLRIRTVRS